ncbi:MAG: cation:proton antiporter [Acidobacteria bacterium]|nr:cation:proton antiporter [Acidobacteriota bacterium]MBI3279604.1 cation:proton antiporter [Acidobacteriota bacterium]
MAFVIAEQGAAAVLFAMLVVFGAAKLLAEVFERLNQPGIVGEIVAGVLIGPSVLHWVAPGETIDTLGELGVIFLLFSVGLEVKSSELVKIGGTATLVAILGVAAPFLLGWGLSALWGYPPVEAIFVGAAMVATSVGITARVLAAKGLLHATASRIILAAAVIDDILGLLVLAIVSGLARGKFEPIELAMTALVAIGFTILVATWGTRTMGRVMARLDANLQAGETQFNLALVLLFGLSLLAIYAGVAAIIGAFLAGMALAESVTERVHHLTQGVTEMLVPFFLAGIGLRLDLSVFAQPATFAFAALLLVAAVLSKLVGCAAGAYRLGRADMFRIGAGMIPRGEVGMVVAQLGLAMGVIQKPVYAIVVFMAVATTLIAPPLLKIAYRSVEPKDAREQYDLG